MQQAVRELGRVQYEPIQHNGQIKIGDAPLTK
jgi:hypothetical protein